MLDRDPQPQEPSLEIHEKSECPRSIQLFIVRHGETRYLERQHVKATGKWNPDLPDLTQKGESDLVDTAKEIGARLDPDQHIIVFFSSPRARTLRSKEVLEDHLRGMGFEVFEQEPVVEILRSGGDKAPLVGSNREVRFTAPDPTYDIVTEDEQETRGERLRQFLSYFAAVDKEALARTIKTSERFHGKIPIFIALTHGEVTHAGINPEDEHSASLLGTAFPDGRRHKLLRGKGMKLEFDLEHPGEFSLELPADANPSHENLVQKLHLNQRNGTIETLNNYRQHNMPPTHS